MRLVFLGTPDAAIPSLRALIDAGHDVALVITRPDRRRGRGSALTPSPVKVAALELGVTVGHQLSDVVDVGAERGVVVAYGAIIPERVIAVVPMLNVHFSLLPRWRGAAPVQRAILAGDTVTGVSIMTLEPSLDTGPVHLERRTDVGEASAFELTERLAEIGASALIEVLSTPELLYNPHPQAGEITYAEKITKETLHLTPSMSSELALRTIRVGGAYFFFGAKRVSVLSARASAEHVALGEVERRGNAIVLGLSDSSVVLEDVRPEGSATMSALAWWSGLRHLEETASWS